MAVNLEQENKKLRMQNKQLRVQISKYRHDVAVPLFSAIRNNVSHDLLLNILNNSVKLDKQITKEGE